MSASGGGGGGGGGGEKGAYSDAPPSFFYANETYEPGRMEWKKKLGKNVFAIRVGAEGRKLRADSSLEGFLPEGAFGVKACFDVEGKEVTQSLNMDLVDFDVAAKIKSEMVVYYEDKDDKCFTWKREEDIMHLNECSWLKEYTSKVFVDALLTREKEGLHAFYARHELLELSTEQWDKFEEPWRRDRRVSLFLSLHASRWVLSCVDAFETKWPIWTQVQLLPGRAFKSTERASQMRDDVVGSWKFGISEAKAELGTPKSLVAVRARMAARIKDIKSNTAREEAQRKEKEEEKRAREEEKRAREAEKEAREAEKEAELVAKAKREASKEADREAKRAEQRKREAEEKRAREAEEKRAAAEKRAAEEKMRAEFFASPKGEAYLGNQAHWEAMQKREAATAAKKSKASEEKAKSKAAKEAEARKVAKEAEKAAEAERYKGRRRGREDDDEEAGGGGGAQRARR
jgi:hypothetical protein